MSRTRMARVQFSAHAMDRYRERRGSAWLDEGRALISYEDGRNISREEAGGIIDWLMQGPRDVFYRLAAEGAGVWVVRWSPGHRPVVVTYLAAGCDVADALVMGL